MRGTSKSVALAATAALMLATASFALPAEAQDAESAQAAPLVPYAQAVPALALPGAADSAPYLDEEGRVIALGADSLTSASDQTEQAALSSCKPISLPDNPHYSGGDVSAHGQWNKGTCTSNTAHVYNCLYEYYSDATWRRKACSARVKLKPKSVSNNRTTARRACDSTSSLISWRNHVDVDVDGQHDPPDEPHRDADVHCVVNG
jgi:hypothetical protein